MEAHIGLFGLLATVGIFMWSKIFAILRFSIPVLQEIALYATIIVAVLTAMWYIGNMLIKRREWLKAVRDIINDYKKRG